MFLLSNTSLTIFRLQDLEGQVSKMVEEHAKLAQEAEDGKKAVAELDELKKLHDLTKVEMEQLKALPRAKISFISLFKFNFSFD